MSSLPCSRDHGSFDLEVKNVYIKIDLKLGNDASGKPTVSTSACSTRISSVHVHFSGKFGYVASLQRTGDPTLAQWKGEVAVRWAPAVPHTPLLAVCFLPILHIATACAQICFEFALPWLHI